jgi:hypothetical protein
MIASNCACCGRPLVDAKSVECGVGPECRKRHGFGEAQHSPDFAAARVHIPEIAGETEADAHKAANVLVYQIALDQAGERVLACVLACAALGYETLAARVAERVSGKLSVLADGTDLLVRTGYSELAVVMYRPLGRWDKEAKAWRIPAARRGELWASLKVLYGGRLLKTDKGIVKIPIDTKYRA